MGTEDICHCLVPLMTRKDIASFPQRYDRPLISRSYFKGPNRSSQSNLQPSGIHSQEGDASGRGAVTPEFKSLGVGPPRVEASRGQGLQVCGGSCFTDQGCEGSGTRGKDRGCSARGKQRFSEYKDSDTRGLSCGEGMVLMLGGSEGWN